MARRKVELSEDTGELRLRFGYDAALVEVIRALPRRRFEAKDKTWYVPAEFAAEVIEALTIWEFEVPAEVRALAERGGRNAQVRRMRRAARTDSLTPSGLNAAVRSALREAFSEDVWVVGEISGWRPSRGCCFFELIERDERGWGGGAQARARVRAVVFEEELGRIAALMQRMTPPLRMADGLEVRLQARVEVYERNGAYQLRVREIDPHHTISAMAQQRERVLEALDDMGISECNLNLPMPPVPLRVGLITSVGSDAFKDFIEELKQSGLGFEVLVFDARMQGVMLERTVLKALDFFAVHHRRVDVVAIIRGGGARTELSQFDTFPIGRAVCQLPIPILCGVGHQADHSLIDDLARSFKTPTAAAAALVALVQSFVADLDALEGALVPEAARRVAERRAALEALASRLGREASLRLSARRMQIDRVGVDLGRSAQAQLKAEGRDLGALCQRAPALALRRVTEARREVDRAGERLDPDRLSRRLSRRGEALAELRARLDRAAGRALRQGAAQEAARARLLGTLRLLGRQQRALDDLQGRIDGAARRQLARRREQVEGLEARRGALDPARVLDRGFAWVTDAEGALVRRGDQIPVGGRLRIRLAVGGLEAIRTEKDERGGQDG